VGCLCPSLPLERPATPRHDLWGTLLSFVDEVHRFVVEYGYLAVFFGILLEDFGLPTPGETMLIAGSVLASRGALSILWLLPVAWLGAVIGDSIGFFIGAFGGHRILVRYGGRIGITLERLQQVEAFFAQYGDIVVVAARFFLILRQLNGIVAGTLEMPWPRFLLYNAIGAALWVGFWGGLTYWLGSRFFEFVHAFGWVGPTIAALAAVALIVLAGKLLWARKFADGKATGPKQPNSER
jgi:membrane protein DedA with SNARE-associated domain